MSVLVRAPVKDKMRRKYSQWCKHAEETKPPPSNGDEGVLM